MGKAHCWLTQPFTRPWDRGSGAQYSPQEGIFKDCCWSSLTGSQVVLFVKGSHWHYGVPCHCRHLWQQMVADEG